MDLRPAIQQLRDQGWTVLDLPDSDVVFGVVDRLLQLLRRSGFPSLRRLDDYHDVVDDDAHIEVLDRLAHYCWDHRFGHQIVERNLAVVQQIVALDLHIQTYPYLRIARPARPGDVVGLHRDTDYGASAYEVSIVVPLTDVDAESALRVVSGSHHAPRTAYPATKRPDLGVTPGSREHRLGFPYAPQVLDASVESRAEPVPLRIGQALCFNLALVHGQAVNSGSTTRVSMDTRVVNSLAPVSWSRGVREDYYSELCSSVVTEQARRFLGSEHTS